MVLSHFNSCAILALFCVCVPVGMVYRSFDFQIRLFCLNSLNFRNFFQKTWVNGFPCVSRERCSKGDPWAKGLGFEATVLQCSLGACWSEMAGGFVLTGVEFDYWMRGFSPPLSWVRAHERGEEEDSIFLILTKKSAGVKIF